ncbi:formate dehydrogenase subunit delta [Acuticoccus mangrovi]|uniref:Formate dehydrogenase subunit delta n=1 Tax=Acuticoccus mangrovi TaxID=2796142 RepID=A0A934MGU5_9HYPH|nr:formate dehydrogenase subunit delta [Acuticoccus mangrovi]MBJ3776968.1 formate dehydrogenase subunit delta [Acuticoccus mangrovi]
MSPEKMVHMANQIATFFRTQPGDDQADRIASHFKDFWEPRMREQLLDYVAHGGAGLDELVLKATKRL